MADSPIKLVNENGRIVGKDPQTGDTIPIEFDSISVDKLYTGTAAGAGGQTLYVDANATGAADGSSWDDAFTTIGDAIDALPSLIANGYVIKVRDSGPYQETATFDETRIAAGGGILLEAERYARGDCESNATQGRIVDTGNLGGIEAGDEVLLMDLSGADGRIVNYERASVTDASATTNSVQTDATVTPTTGWRYAIATTEISGSDDGTDSGTARQNCVFISNARVALRGFQLTYADQYAVEARSHCLALIMACICENNDRGPRAYDVGVVDFIDSYSESTEFQALVANRQSYISTERAVAATTASGQAALYSDFNSSIIGDETYIYDGFYVLQVTGGKSKLYRSYITSGVDNGIRAELNGAVGTFALTNNSPTPTETATGGQIG